MTFGYVDVTLHSMTKKQLKQINQVADKIAQDFIVSAEDNTTPRVYVTKDKAFIYAGYAFDTVLGEHVQPVYDVKDLTKYDVEDLLENAGQWLYSYIFREYFKAK